MTHRLEQARTRLAATATGITAFRAEVEARLRALPLVAAREQQPREISDEENEAMNWLHGEGAETDR